MNTDTHRNGCHNRPEFAERRMVQDGHYIDGHTSAPRMISIPNYSYRKPCEYRHTEAGKADRGCDGCKRKDEVAHGI